MVHGQHADVDNLGRGVHVRSGHGGGVVNEHVDVHMRDSDAFSWYMENDPLLRSTVVSVMILDR